MADLRYQDEDDPNVFLDVLTAPFRGVEGAAQSVYNLADYVTGDILPDYDTRLFGESKTTAGGITEGISQFLVGFVPFIGVAGKVGKAAQAGKLGAAMRHNKLLTTQMGQAATAGIAADFTVFDGQEDRLSNLIQANPILANPVTEFLAADEDDPFVVGRFKNALEGLGLGLAADGLIRGVKAIKKGRKAKTESNDPDLVAKTVNASLVRDVRRDISLNNTTEEILTKPVPFKTYEEAGKERPKGADTILNRLRLEANVVKSNKESVEEVEEFINTIGKRMFDDVSISISAKLDDKGVFNFATNLMTLRKSLLQDGELEEAAIHELWHSLSRYLPSEELVKYDKQFEAEKAKFIKDNPQLGKDIEASIFNQSTYKYADIDEYFAMNMTEAWFEQADVLAKLAPVGTLKRLTQEVGIMFSDLFENIKAALGGDRTKKILRDFMKKNEKYQGVKREVPLEFDESLFGFPVVQGGVKQMPQLRSYSESEIKSSAPAWFKESNGDLDTSISTERAGDTQRVNTDPTYDKAAQLVQPGKTLDLGAGLGRGSKKYGFDSVEPNPSFTKKNSKWKEGEFEPNYRFSSEVPDNSYENIISLNVVNVLDPETRLGLIEDVGRILKEGGTAFIGSRGKEVFGTPNKITRGKLSKLEPGAIHTTGGTYQKGYTNKELKQYVEEVLGDGFTVEPQKGLGTSGVKITKKKGYTKQLPDLPKGKGKVEDDMLEGLADDETFESMSEDMFDVDMDNPRVRAVYDDKILKEAMEGVRNAAAQGDLDTAIGKVVRDYRFPDAKSRYDFFRALTNEVRKNKNFQAGETLTLEQSTNAAKMEFELMTSRQRKEAEGVLGVTKSIEMAEQVRRDAMVYNLILKQKYDSMLDTAKNISSVKGEIKSVADVQEQLEDLYEYISLHSALGREMGLALGQRRRLFANKKAANNRPMIKDEKLGGANSEAYMRDKREKWVEQAIEILKEGGDPKEAMRKLAGIAEGTQGGKLDMLREMWINNILSGLPTQAANILGNSIAYVLHTGEAAIGHLASGDFHLAKEAIKAAVDIDTLFGDSLRWAGKSLKEEGQYIIPDHAAFSEGGVRSSLTPENISRQTGIDAPQDSMAYQLFNSAAFALRLPSRGLNAADEWFKQINARRAAKYKAAVQAIESGVTDPQEIAKKVQETIDRLVVESGEIYSERAITAEAIRKADERGLTGNHQANFIKKYVKDNYDPDQSAIADYARSVAEEMTFTEDLGSKGQAVQRLIREMPALSFVMPFVRTPVNIMKFAFHRLGGNFPNINSTQTKYFSDLRSSDVMVSAAAKGRMATTAAATANLFAAMTVMRDRISGGGPVDAKQKQALIDQGWQPYSIKAGDTWYSYQRLDPMATIIGVMADIRDAWHDSNYGFNDENPQRVLTTLLVLLQRNITNKSYLSGVEMLNDAMSDTSGNQAIRMVNNIAAGFIPFAGFQKHTQNIIGTQEAKEVRGLADRFLMTSAIPGFNRARLDPKRNIIGETKMIELTPGFGALSPISWSTDKKDALLDEFANLNHAFRQVNPIHQGVLDLLQYSNDKGQSAHDRRLELIGTTQIGGKNVRQALERLIKSKRYQSLDPRSEPGLTSPRVLEINKILTKYRSKALQQTLSEFPELARYHKEFTRAKRNQRRGQAMDELLQTLNF